MLPSVKSIVKVLLFTCLFCSIGTFGFANEVLLECPTTPQIWDIATPPEAHKTNNLRRKTGSDEFAKGERITITGRVVDENCIPVTNVIVHMWQKNANGVYEYEDGNWDKKDPNFYGSGTAVTNNLGEYSFFTILPKGSKTQSSHTNLRVSHRDFLPMETKVFFKEHLGKGKNKATMKLMGKKDFKAISIAGKQKDMEMLYNFNIVLEGQVWYKRY